MLQAGCCQHTVLWVSYKMLDWTESIVLSTSFRWVSGFQVSLIDQWHMVFGANNYVWATRL